MVNVGAGFSRFKYVQVQQYGKQVILMIEFLTERLT
jgi:hypothetical protein